MNWSLLIYWLIVLATAIAILAIQAKKNACGIIDYAGKLFGYFLKDNNWRWVLGVLLTVVLTISAILAGFGRPLLTSSAKEVKTSLTEKLNNHPQAKAEIKSLLWGTNGAPSVFTPARVIEKRYPSWWHWKIALLCGVVTFFYTFFAFRDEMTKAIKAAIKAVERRKRLNRIREGSVTTTIVTPAQAAQPRPTGAITKANLITRILQVDILMEVAQIFFKLLFKKVGNLFTK